MENGKLIYISLANWPTNPIHHKNIQLTPITKKILKQVHLKTKDLLPLTFQSFLSQSQHSQYQQSKKQANQQYQLEIDRRKKKMVILADIRKKYIEGKQYNKKQQQTRSTIKSRIDQQILKSIRSSQILHCKEQNNNQMKCQKKQRNLSKTSPNKICFKSPLIKKKVKSKESSDQLVKYSSFHTETQSKIQKSNKASSKINVKTNLVKHVERQQSQYFGSQNTNRMLRLKSVKQKESDILLCKQLIQTLQKWQQLDNHHMKQLSRIKDLSPQQKDRLAKIQSIEKIQMQKRIKRIKSKLAPQIYY